MSTARTIDARALPVDVVSPMALLWWGVMGMILIETVMFAIVIASYFYLRQTFAAWPPEGTPEPDLLPGIVSGAVFLASVVPMAIVDRLTPEGSDDQLRWWLAASSALCVACLACRWFEFQAFHTRWDQHAYGSVVFLALGVHTTHTLTSALETIVMTVDFFLRPVEKKMRIDAKVNSLYWYFVVAWWLIVGGVMYVAPRVI